MFVRRFNPDSGEKLDDKELVNQALYMTAYLYEIGYIQGINCVNGDVSSEESYYGGISITPKGYDRIYRDYIDNYAFSFDRQKFISDFYQEYNDMKSFEAAILELVLDKQKEQYTLILNSLKTEIEKSIQAYEIRPLSDRAIERACYQHMERYSQEIEAQLDVTRSLSKPLNEANNRYDSIGYREHTAEEEKQAEKEYERCKAEYDREKAKLNKLYDQQKATRTEAFQYMKNCCADIYRQSCLFLDILKKYIPDGKQENKSSEPISQQETTEEQQEYFSMKLLSLIHEVCEGEQFEEISAPDFYANMNLHPCNCKLKIKPREKIQELAKPMIKNQYGQYLLKLTM
jgi:hypothetical protein